MKQVPSVSIGIPAYNEEHNIGKVLRQILDQDQTSYTLTEIIIVSDGSTDKTEAVVQTFQDKRIKLVSHKQRLGKSARINEIFQLFNSEILFLVDADITITDTKVLSKITAYSDFSSAGIVAINATPLKGQSFFENAINFGAGIQSDIRRRWNNGNNYLAFKGCILGLWSSYAKKLILPQKLINNDAYLYFSAANTGFRPKYLPDICVFYHSPVTFSDHSKQSSRYQVSFDELQSYIPSITLKDYQIPFDIYLSSLIRAFFANPVYFSAYLLIFILAKFRKHSSVSSVWEIAYSTKKTA